VVAEDVALTDEKATDAGVVGLGAKDRAKAKDRVRVRVRVRVRGRASNKHLA
jgi:hypothetical protein